MKSNAFFDAAAPLRAVNKLASNVIKPAHIDNTFHKPNQEIGRSESHDPIPWTQVGPNFSGINFAGRRIGRLTVLGVSVERKASGRLRWVCRCACGTYMLRTTKGLKGDPKKEAFACSDCINLARMKRNEYVRRTGKPADSEDFL